MPGKKITITASSSGVGLAESSLRRLGFESKGSFAKALLMGKSTVDKFFSGKSIQIDSFKRICEGLKIENWKDIADLENKTEYSPLDSIEENTTNQEHLVVTSNKSQVNSLASRNMTVTSRESGEIQAEIILEGNISDVNSKTVLVLEALLKKYAGSPIKITSVEAGSIKLTIQGSQKSVINLMSRINSEVSLDLGNFPIRNIQILGPISLQILVGGSNQRKWNLVREIIINPTFNRNLRGQDLSEADLSEAELRGADLTEADLAEADLYKTAFNAANLTGANLSNANLKSAYIVDANLKWANFSNANLQNAHILGSIFIETNLTNANLKNADLRFASFEQIDLRGAIVEACNFGQGFGLSELDKFELRKKGAIFNETSGDRSSIYSSSRR
jgi:uncharacterized protein YjbI with pentapeptide repeats